MARFTLQFVGAAARDYAAVERAIRTLPASIDQAALRSALAGQTRVILAHNATREGLEPLHLALWNAGFKTRIVESVPRPGQGAAKPKTVSTLLSDDQPVREMAGFDWRENLGLIGLVLAGLLIVGAVLYASNQFTRALPPPTVDELAHLADVGAQARDSVPPPANAGGSLKAGASVAAETADVDLAPAVAARKGPPFASAVGIVILVVVLLVPLVLRGWLNENLDPRRRMILRLVILSAGATASMSSVIFAIPWLQQVSGFKGAKRHPSMREVAQAAQIMRAGQARSTGQPKKGGPMNVSAEIPMGMLASDSEDSGGDPEAGGPEGPQQGSAANEQKPAGEGSPGGVNLDLKLTPGKKPAAKKTAKHWRMDKLPPVTNPLASGPGRKPVKHFTHLFSKLAADKVRKSRSQARHGKFGAMLDTFRSQAGLAKSGGGGGGAPMSMKVSGGVGGLAAQAAALEKGAPPHPGASASGAEKAKGGGSARLAEAGGKPGATGPQRGSKIDTSGLDSSDPSRGATAEPEEAKPDQVATAKAKPPSRDARSPDRPAREEPPPVAARTPGHAEHKQNRSPETAGRETAGRPQYPGEDRLPPQAPPGDPAAQQARRDFEREAREEAAREAGSEGGAPSGSPANHAAPSAGAPHGNRAPPAMAPTVAQADAPPTAATSPASEKAPEASAEKEATADEPTPDTTAAGVHAPGASRTAHQNSQAEGQAKADAPAPAEVKGQEIVETPPTPVPAPRPPEPEPVRRAGPFAHLLARVAASTIPGSRPRAQRVVTAAAITPHPAVDVFRRGSALQTRLAVADANAFDEGPTRFSAIRAQPRGPERVVDGRERQAIIFRQGQPLVMKTVSRAPGGTPAPTRRDWLGLGAALLLGVLLAGLIPWAWRLWRPAETGVFQHDRPAIRYSAAGMVVLGLAGAAVLVAGPLLHTAGKHGASPSSTVTSSESAFVGAVGVRRAYGDGAPRFGNLYSWLGRENESPAAGSRGQTFSTVLADLRVDAATNVLWATAIAATREAEARGQLTRRSLAVRADTSDQDCAPAPLERARMSAAARDERPASRAAVSVENPARSTVAARERPASPARSAFIPPVLARGLTLLLGLLAGGVAVVLVRRRREAA